MLMNNYVYIYMTGIHKFEREKGREYIKAWRKERKFKNYAIII